MAHNHDHAGGHGHHHHGAGSNIKVAFFLNLGFTVLEIFGGLWINSVAILSDALHDLGDSLSLGLAWYFEKVAKRGRNEKYTFGYKRFSLLGAVINSVILLVGSFFILWEAVPRIWDPQEVNAPGMMAFAVIGILVNGAAVLRLKSGDSLNERAVRLHLLEDVLGWVAVLVGGIVMYFYDVPFLDPLLSVIITLYVLYNVIGNLRDTSKILLQASPPHIKPDDVAAKLKSVEEIKSLHDLHIWTLDGSYNVLTMHAVVAPNLPAQQAQDLKKRVRSLMADMDIQHVTLELEAPGEECSHQSAI
ncbi:cation diffusion facilitator family transporter [Pontibacter akesuensis]|uniref:Cobalt-zinc-cadmium efflux system protein n=1 Tax=Pontibacter akesuensis TaxID=388950 RepID=A0A1I7KGJ9_9BACT|nr:cation diffusion facilitator family transporter [Pontibacter akesuensis]GHA79241.1 cobalt transporter [Pontibacter akesuensis]SFU96561.1 cobalt-zinc-cadmium efflux system protein [Pontibacter akesuensis]